MLEEVTRARRRLFVLGFVLSACGASVLDWKARPAQPESPAWHCLATGTGSFCEKTFDACRVAHRYVSQRTVSVQETTADCAPAREVWCFSYVLSPKHPPASRDFRSVREPGVEGWVYDCAAAQSTCEANQSRVVKDRTDASEETSDVSPCERWVIRR